MTGSIELDPDGETLQIRFPYRPDLVEDVKAIPGRRWDRGGKLWRVPTGQVENVVALFMKHGFTMTADVTSLLAGTQGVRAKKEAKKKEDPDAEVGPDAMSISGLNEKVKKALMGAFPESVWVVGELADFDKNKDRQHVFFNLLEKRGETIAAQVSVAMFERTAKMLNAKLENLAEPLRLADGIEIRALVKVDLYPRAGRFQLIIDDIDPSFTLGKLALGREEVLKELREKGLDKLNSALPMPVPPLRVGVLTSHESDGWNDFVAEMKSSEIGFEITSYNVRVQGDLLRPSMLQGLRYFAKRADDFDVLCVLRGGGSRTDLAWFDDRDVAIAVAKHPLKIVCGIGHQRDVSVLDMITHSEKTPTAVADHLIQQVQQARGVLTDLTRCFVDTARNVLRAEDRGLTERAHNLRRLVQGQLAGAKEFLTAANGRLARGTKGRVRRAQDDLVRRWEQVRNGVRMHLLHHKGVMSGRQKRLVAGSNRRLDQARSFLATQRARQRLLDPTAVLKRGYTLVRIPDGGILTDVAKLQAGQAVDIQFRDGRAGATIDDVNAND